MGEPADQTARHLIRSGTDRTLFVSAGAGSGKTTSLVGRVAQLVLVDGVPIQRIATVTFTIKAAAELRDRLREEFEGTVRAESDTVRGQRAQQALDDLDLAAIGTLHAFAQRILTAHPIEAALPPRVEVLDEVGSAIAFQERWTRIQQDLLDDDAVSEPLIVGMAAGVTLRQVRQLVRLLGQDWDRIRENVISDRPAPLTMPDLSAIEDALITLSELRSQCTNTADKLYPKLIEIEDYLRSLKSAPSLRALLEALPAIDGLKKLGNTGARGAWPILDPKGVRDAAKEALDDVLAIRWDIVGQCLRHLAHWAGVRVLAEAEERRRSGRLEFHDLLVIARDLLTTNDDARATLYDTYERLLLDEFQDTDPIQIEIAVRIAGGRNASQEDWKDVVVPAGRLFVVGDAKQSIYRFRRASIATYLQAQSVIGTSSTLDTNFRSGAGVVDWVNAVFGKLIQFEEDGQPAYEPLVAYRASDPDPIGASVTVLGAVAQPQMSADELREREAADVAGVVSRILRERWTIKDPTTGDWREARPADIAVLIPSRRSMASLEEALDGAGLNFRAEAMSLVYEAPEIRDLLAVARAISDPTDQLALVTALRSPLFGCGDDDLLAWRTADGYFNMFAPVPENVPADSPVAAGIAALVRLERTARWLTPSELLARIVEDRRLLEIGAHLPRPLDSWRRLRFVVDQARAWTEVAHGGLRGYLAWVSHQAEEKARVSEAILPEHDVDAVRVMTVHAAKGLEFPIVILSGMTTQPRREYGVRLLWPATGGYRVSLTKDLRDPSFESEAVVEEQMSDLERTRLLYVAATRARDHLVVSLHRVGSEGGDREARTPAEVIHMAGGAEAGAPLHFELDDAEPVVASGSHRPAPPPDFDGWLQGILRAREFSRRPGARTASGLEGTEPEVVLAEAEAGRAKGARDLELPPWSKGRYGSAVGRAVHGVLQVVDLATGAGLDDAVRGQVVAEGIVEHADVVEKLVRSALASEVVQRAATRQHWREVYVGASDDDGVLTEGIIDLLFRDDDGSLVVVDYKTDVVTAETLADKVSYYRPQLQAYRRLVVATTGSEASSRLLFLHPEGSHLAAV